MPYRADAVTYLCSGDVYGFVVFLRLLRNRSRTTDGWYHGLGAGQVRGDPSVEVGWGTTVGGPKERALCHFLSFSAALEIFWSRSIAWYALRQL